MHTSLLAYAQQEINTPLLHIKLGEKGSNRIYHLSVFWE